MPAWTRPPPHALRDGSGRAPTPQPQAGWFRQWRVLTRRTFEPLVRSPLTLAILLGSPVMVVAMFAILFQRGVFASEHPSPSSIVMIVFWVAFAAFFFGLTYGLLQVTTERAILQREHFVGLRLGPYLFSKLAVLLPFLVIVDVLMLAVLRGLDRLPAAPLATYLTVGTTIALEAAAALSLGLLTSAAVRTPSQATLALPLLCFPAVLFSGAILPVHLMAGLGAAISVLMPVRWAFEAIGHDLAVRKLLSAGGSPLGPPLIASYGDAGNLSTGTYWLILGSFTLALFLGAWLTLRATCRRRGR
jgi:hypothetical protein